MKKRMTVLLVVLLVAFAACGDDDAASTTTTATTMGDMNMDDGDHMEEFAFGEPADAADADRVIEISGSDDFTFTPSSVTVTAGETVTFRVTNTGAIPHDFTLGDAEMQDEHDAEMAEMGGMAMDHNEPNVFNLQPGETKEMTWHLTQPGELIFGCHQIGHYAAGMKGTLTVEG